LARAVHARVVRALVLVIAVDSIHAGRDRDAVTGVRIALLALGALYCRVAAGAVGRVAYIIRAKVFVTAVNLRPDTVAGIADIVLGAQVLIVALAAVVHRGRHTDVIHAPAYVAQIVQVGAIALTLNTLHAHVINAEALFARVGINAVPINALDSLACTLRTWIVIRALRT
jgi:hypothetical protein